MNIKDAIRKQITLADFLVSSYLTDLTQNQFLQRPAGKANHISWQLGHLVSSEHGMMEYVQKGGSPALPKGFKEQHTADTAALDDPDAFLKKEEYLALYAAQREATLSILDALSEADMDKESPEHMRKLVATVGEMLVLIAGHPLMHVGQWVVLRRELGKEILI